MKQSILLLITSILLSQLVKSQVNTENITIARDSFGVPHIFSNTDAEAAYGLAWAHAEDDFENIQKNLIAAKGMLGRLEGKDGVLFDFALQFLSIDSFVDARYEKDLSAEFRNVIEGYTQAINDFAKAHPKQVLLKKAFPFTGKDVITGYVLNTSLMAGLGLTLKAINENRIDEFFTPNEIGSNAIAIAPERTEDNQTYLAINSHQPLEGRFAWYEAHISSKEGWEIIGGLFPGGLSIFVGTNKHLGWAHTTNYHNFGDIYLLEINPENKNQYKYAGKWVDFQERKIPLKVKIIGIRIPVKKKVKISTYGPVFETKEGMYAIRFPATKEIRAAEQWYKMNKAENIDAFETALKMQTIPLFNVVYGDKDGNVLMHSGGIVPNRNPSLDWSVPITSDNPQYKWNWKDNVPYSRMPLVKNPKCGFVYNSNNTPLRASGEGCNWDEYFPGLQLFTYNRGERMMELMDDRTDKFTWQDFHDIKFDKCYSKSGSYASHFKNVFDLDAKDYPHIAKSIEKIKNWNFCGEVDNIDAALILLIHEHLRKKISAPFAFLMIREAIISEGDAVEAVEYAQKFLLKKFGSLDIELGEIQKLQRGDVAFPTSGMREVLRAADAKLYNKKKGLFRITSGDGYMQMVKFPKNSDPIIYSINAFGSSADPESPHYTDQMEIFVNESFKQMTFDKDKILEEAIRIYNPNSQ